MTADAALERRLDDFLGDRGVTRAAILAGVDGPFGRPLLVVASGSVLLGHGNSRSDVDLYVVVDSEVTRLPISSYLDQLQIDVTYFSADEVNAWVQGIRGASWPPAGPLDIPEWERRAGAIFYCARFGCGLALESGDGWDRWCNELHEPWFSARVRHWWLVECRRRHLASRWLASAKPVLAAQRGLEAIFAFLESRAAEAGHYYSGPKWISRKLEEVGDALGLKILRSFMRTPTTAADAVAYLERCASLLGEIDASTDGLRAQLWYLPGVSVLPYVDRTFVDRWKMLGLELQGTAPSLPAPRAPIWEGGFDTPPPTAIHDLFVGGMTWLSLVAEEA